MKELLFTIFAIFKVAHCVPPTLIFPKSEATEGERCGGRQGPWCGDGLRCIGRALLVDGQGTCIREATNCPPGIGIVNCFTDPCSFEECPANSDATCVSSYCGGCSAVFYDQTGQNIVDCTELKQDGEKCGSCFGGPPNNPCDYGTCATGLECISNPLLPDAAGKCRKVKQIGETCGACFGPQCDHGPCAAGLECVHNALLPDAPGKCKKRKQINESCGSCFGPQCNYGSCDLGLECVYDQTLPDAPGKCRNPPTITAPIEIKHEGEICGQCYNPNNNNFCGRCAPGLDCTPQHTPGLPDAPGKCEKQIEECGLQCTPAITCVRSPFDSCNTCICNPDGTLGGCTLILCLPEFSDEGESCGANAESGWSKECKPGLKCDSQQNSDGFHGTCVKQEGRCPPGAIDIPSPYDSCNTCSCNDDGTIRGCTRIACRPKPDQGLFKNYDKLLYCAKEGEDGGNECEQKTDGEFTTCHEIITIEKCNGVFCHGVCVPGDKECKSDDGCKPIGDGDSGLLRAHCNNRKCQYDGAIILH